MNRVNVFLLSTDYKLKMSLSDTLAQDKGLNVDAICHSMDAVQGKITRNFTNILVLDTDAYNLDLRFLKALMEKHMLYIIMLAKKMPFYDPVIQFVMKPHNSTQESLMAVAKIILQKIKSLSSSAPSFSMRDIANYVDAKHKLIAIAASAGGTEALPVLISQLPANISPIIIVLHMPSMFTKQFADRLDKMSAVSVSEAKNGEFIKKGNAYIAPGDLHMKLVVRQQKLALECFHSDKVHGVRPAADITLESVAKISGPNAIGVILTGMGADGARGLMEMRQKGAQTIGQNKETCTVYGMPRVAYELGAVEYQLPLNDIANKILALGG